MIAEHCSTCNGSIQMFGLNRNFGNVELPIGFTKEYHVYITDSVKAANTCSISTKQLNQHSAVDCQNVVTDFKQTFLG